MANRFSYGVSHFFSHLQLPARETPAYPRDAWYYTCERARDARCIIDDSKIKYQRSKTQIK